MKNNSGQLIWLIVYLLIFSCFWLDTTVYARSVRNISLARQYALSEVIGKDQPYYHAHVRNTEIMLSNRNQEFTAKLYDDAGLVIQHQNHHIRMRLVAVGAGGYIQNLSQAQEKVSVNQISYDQGPIKQWFVNGPMGLQQGFTINKRPGKNKTGNLVLTLNVHSDLQPRPAIGSRGADFVTTDEEVVLQYTGLMVVDADTRQLPAHIETHRNQIDIVVDDSKAVYPVIIDPIFQQAKLTASDGAGDDEFGSSVAIDGDIVVVGAPGNTVGANNNQGAVYVFEKSSDSWTLLAKLTASDGKSWDGFGFCVAINNNVIVVGAPDHDTEGHDDQGVVYVYIKPDSGWKNIHESARLTASDGIKYAEFGNSIAIDQDTIVVGDALADIDRLGDNKGAAYIFVKPITGWVNTTENAKLLASDGWPNDLFGSSVAVSQDTVVVGASHAALGSSDSRQGAVYVFEKPVSGWTSMYETAQLLASDRAEYDGLGKSVAIDHNTIVAGAGKYDTNGKLWVGAAYVFTKPVTGWKDKTENAKLTAADAMEDDFFGHAVAIDGNTIVIGSPYHDRTGWSPTGLPYYIPDMGAVYTFSRPSGGWHDLQTKASMISSDGRTDDHLGKSVAISGSTIVAGAPDQDLSGKTDQGAAYVFRYKKKNAWPMFISAVTSHIGHVVAGNTRVNAPDPSDQNTKYIKFTGTMTLEFGNTTYPHFDKKKDSFCTLWMPVTGDVGQLTCSPEILSYNEIEEDGTGGKYRYRGSINFQPTGSCKRSTNTCRVADGASGSETQWWWVWDGTSWVPIPGTPWSGPLNGFGNTYDFGMTKVLSGGETIGGTLVRTIRWTLWLMPAP